MSKRFYSILIVVMFLASVSFVLTGCKNEVSPEMVNYGTITGKVLYSNSDDHSGIVLTLDKTDGIRAITTSDGSKAITAMSTSKADGSFAFYNLEPGTYTVYASSNDSLEKAVSTNVVVEGSKTVTIEDLHLTATGSLAGYVTIDGAETGNAGFIVSIAGTSYMATTTDNGYYCITGIPAGTGYSLIAVKGSYMAVVGTCGVEALKVSVVNVKNLSSDDIESGNNSLIWKGSFASESNLASPKRNWAYYNTADGCSYIFDGTQWTLLASKGDQGEQGVQGEKGDKGDTGETGATGASGANGISITWKGSLPSAPPIAVLYWAYYNTEDGCSYIYDGTKWTLLASKGAQGEQGIQGEQGPQGETGATGAQGEAGATGATGAAGADGVSIIWLGSYASAPENPDRLNAYYNTETGCSYIYNGTTWDLLASKGAQGEQGPQGEQGQTGATGTSITWKGSLDAAPANPSLYWAYYDTTDGCSYIYDGTQWTLLASRGAQGIPGAIGATGATGAAGTDGVSIIWLGSFATDPENPARMNAYYNTDTGCSYIYDGTKWTLLARKGDQGEPAPDECSHLWDEDDNSVKMTYFREGIKSFTCRNCSAHYSASVHDEDCQYENGFVVKRIISDKYYELYSYDETLKVNSQVFFNDELIRTSIYDVNESYGPVKNTCYLSSGKLDNIDLYNEFGKLVYRTIYDNNGVISSTVEYEYNSEGYCIKEVAYYPSGSKEYECTFDGTKASRWLDWIDYDESGNVTEYGEIQYNSAGYRTMFIAYYPSGTKAIEETCDGTSAQKLLSRIDYDQSGKIDYWEEYKYNSEGYLIKTISHYSSGEIESESIFDGTASIRRQISSTRYDKSGNVISRSGYEYNTDGFVTKYIGYYPSGEKSIETTYDGTSARRTLLSINYDRSGNVTSRSEYEYNTDGLLTKTVSYNSTGIKTSETIYDGTSEWRVLCKIIYDQSGNETGRKDYEYNSDGYLTKRIDYTLGVKRSEAIYDGSSAQLQLSSINYDQSGNVTGRSEYEYSADGHRKRIDYYSSGVKRSETIYNGTGLAIRSTNYDQSGNMTGWYEAEYNSEDHLVKDTAYYASGVKERETIYDGTDNEIPVSTTWYDKLGRITQFNEYNFEGYLIKRILYYASGAKESETIFDGTSEQNVISVAYYVDNPFVGSWSYIEDLPYNPGTEGKISCGVSYCEGLIFTETQYQYYSQYIVVDEALLREVAAEYIDYYSSVMTVSEILEGLNYGSCEMTGSVPAEYTIDANGYVRLPILGDGDYLMVEGGNLILRFMYDDSDDVVIPKDSVTKEFTENYYPDPEPGSDPIPSNSVENILGEVSNNLIPEGDFESGISIVQPDGATFELVSESGLNGSNALAVTPEESYGQVLVDITEYYGRGKSYYVEAWFKDNGSNTSDDLNAHIFFSVVTGAGFEARGQLFDIPGQYDGEWLSDDEAMEIFGFDTNCLGANLSDGEWHKVSAVLDAVTIENVMNAEDSFNNGSGEPTMLQLALLFYVGTFPYQNEYKYLLDNVVIMDLNSEIPIEGRTYSRIYNVTYDYQNGDIITTQFTGPGILPVVPVPYRDGFVFDGWYYDADCTLKYDSQSLVFSDITLYASWVNNLSLEENVILVRPADGATYGSMVGKTQFLLNQVINAYEPIEFLATFPDYVTRISVRQGGGSNYKFIDVYTTDLEKNSEDWYIIHVPADCVSFLDNDGNSCGWWFGLGITAFLPDETKENFYFAIKDLKINNSLVDLRDIEDDYVTTYFDCPNQLDVTINPPSE